MLLAAGFTGGLVAFRTLFEALRSKPRGDLHIGLPHLEQFDLDQVVVG